jgi:hypothetical protein
MYVPPLDIEQVLYYQQLKHQYDINRFSSSITFAFFLVNFL